MAATRRRAFRVGGADHDARPGSQVSGVRRGVRPALDRLGHCVRGRRCGAMDAHRALCRGDWIPLAEGCAAGSGAPGVVRVERTHPQPSLPSGRGLRKWERRESSNWNPGGFSPVFEGTRAQRRWGCQGGARSDSRASGCRFRGAGARRCRGERARWRGADRR